MEYIVSIEINRKQHEIGTISGNSFDDARFAYADSYLNMQGCEPVSLGLPLRREPFSPVETRCFFEGLLPESFTRRTIASRMHFDENDYISILHGLGQECIGAIRVYTLQEKPESGYEKINDIQLRELASEGASVSANIIVKSHLSLAGASGKVGLYFDEKTGEWYLPHGLAPSTHIVKQSHVRLDSIVINEQLCLMTASKCGIETPDSFIISTSSNDDENVLLALNRYDRIVTGQSETIDGLSVPARLHQEDFAQAMGINAVNKYEADGRRGYAGKMFDLLRKHSASPIDDQIKLLDRMIFNCVLGNTDSHIKNYSLLYNEKLSTMRLAPAYDMICTLVYESSTHDLSISIGNATTIDEITRDSFKMLAEDIGITEKVVLERYDKICTCFESALFESAHELSDMGFTKAKTIAERIHKSVKKNRPF